MSGFLQRNRFLFLVIFFTVLIIGGMLILNDVVISLRMLELKAYLLDINREASKVDHLGMVTKYRLHKQLYDDMISQATFDQQELISAGVISSYTKESALRVTKYTYLSKPVILIMNMLRFLLNKKPIQSAFSDPLSDDLTNAYFYERNKQYEKALSMYDQLSQNRIINTTQLPTIILHQGFCLAILSRYNEARIKYDYIMHNYPNTEIAGVAWMLRTFLDEIENEINRIKASDANALEKSKKLYELIAYEDAINILKENTAEDKETITQIKYLEARLQEETGKTEESIKTYQDIIQEDHTSEEAKLANRRLMVIASIDKVDDISTKLKELSKKNNELIQDTTFEELVETAEKVETEIAPERITEDLARTHTPTPGNTLPQNTPTPDEQPASAGEDAPPSPTFTLDDYLRLSLQKVNMQIDIKAGLITPIPAQTSMPTLVPTPVSTSVPKITPTLRPRQTQPPRATPRVTRRPDPTSTPTLAPTPLPTGPYERKYFDSKGRIFKVEKYDQTGKMYRYDIYTWGNEGAPLSASSYNPDGSLIPD